MGQLMMQDVPEILIRSGEGNYYPVFENLGEPPHPFLDKIGNDIGLLKIVMRIVEDHRNPFAQIIAKFFFNLQICILQNICCEFG